MDAFLGHQAHDLAAPAHAAAQGPGLGIRQGTDRGLDLFGKSGQHLRIQRIGLGSLPQGPGKVPDLARIGEGHRPSRL